MPRERNRRRSGASKAKAGVSRGKWQLQTAKAKLSEVIRQARTNGPQVVTKQGKDEAVILSFEDFLNLKRRTRQPGSLVDFFRNSPLAEAGIDLDRDKDPGRAIEL